MGKYLAVVPAFRVVTLRGKRRKRLFAHIREAIQAHVESRRLHDEPIYSEIRSEKIVVAV